MISTGAVLENNGSASTKPSKCAQELIDVFIDGMLLVSLDKISVETVQLKSELKVGLSLSNAVPFDFPDKRPPAPMIDTCD